MSRYDAIIIGGGPAGSTAALSLRRLGRQVIVLEKETFPRFHIGESLLPYNRRLMDTLGLLPLMEQAGFVRKTGAQFWLGDGSKHVQFIFTNSAYNEEPASWQVERAILDDLLLKEAARRGAEVREGCAVSSYAIHDDRVTVQTAGGEIEGAFLIDATGQANFTGTREGLRELHPRHRKIAIFGHFDGIPLAEGERGNDIIIVRLEHEWAWIIPLRRDKVSVGLVIDQAAFKATGLTPQQAFDQALARSSVLREKMARATPLGPLRVIADYSYTNRRFASPRLMRVGDAAGFMDPIFSSGVLVAMESAHAAAQAVDHALSQNAAFTRRMEDYERWLRRCMARYTRMIEKFYTTPFIEIFVEPRPFLRMPDAISELLAGRLDLRWAVLWRLEVFYFLVWLRARLPFTEPIRFN